MKGEDGLGTPSSATGGWVGGGAREGVVGLGGTGDGDRTREDEKN